MGPGYGNQTLSIPATRSFINFVTMLKSVIYFKTYSRLVLISQQNVQKGSKRLPGPNGVGLNKALHGYAKWFKDIYFPGCKPIPGSRRMIKYLHSIQHVPNMAIGPIIVLQHATTLTMHLVPSSQIDPSTTPSIGSGSGFFVTSLFSTGKSMFSCETG